MNEVIVRPPQGQEIGIAKALTKLHANVIEPVEQTPWLFKGEDRDEFHRNAESLPGDLSRVNIDIWHRAKHVSAIAPSDREIAAYGNALDVANDAEPDRGQTRAIVAMLLDVYPSGRPANLTAYADAILHDLIVMRFTPTAVALGCEALRRTLKFLPSVGEVIEACSNAKERLAQKRKHHDYLAGKVARVRVIASLPQPESTDRDDLGATGHLDHSDILEKFTSTRSHDGLTRLGNR